MAVCCCLFSVACSLVGDQSRSCDMSEGQETLEAAGLGTEGLTVVEDCTEVYEGLRQGEQRTAVAKGTKPRSMMRWGPVASTSLRDRRRPSKPELLPTRSTFPPHPLTSNGRRVSGWATETRSSTAGASGIGTSRGGREQGDEDYMVAVVLETGSM
jgi:hypothetical protein